MAWEIVQQDIAEEEEIVAVEEHLVLDFVAERLFDHSIHLLLPLLYFSKHAMNPFL